MSIASIYRLLRDVRDLIDELPMGHRKAYNARHYNCAYHLKHALKPPSEIEQDLFDLGDDIEKEIELLNA